MITFYITNRYEFLFKLCEELYFAELESDMIWKYRFDSHKFMHFVVLFEDSKFSLTDAHHEKIRTVIPRNL